MSRLASGYPKQPQPNTLTDCSLIAFRFHKKTSRPPSAGFELALKKYYRKYKLMPSFRLNKYFITEKLA
jgi:hypothetical protein